MASNATFPRSSIIYLPSSPNLHTPLSVTTPALGSETSSDNDQADIEHDEPAPSQNHPTTCGICGAWAATAKEAVEIGHYLLEQNKLDTAVIQRLTGNLNILRRRVRQTESSLPDPVALAAELVVLTTTTITLTAHVEAIEALLRGRSATAESG